MVHVIGFDSPEEMYDHLRRQRAAALASLKPAQRGLTLGSHWCQFVDVAARHVVFGRVHTVQEVRAGELEAGATKREAEGVIEETLLQLRDGLMYGTAYDLYNPYGELGYTHKARAWPIEADLFHAAREVQWQIDLLPVAQKINLHLAFRATREA